MSRRGRARTYERANRLAKEGERGGSNLPYLEVAPLMGRWRVSVQRIQTRGRVSAEPVQAQTVPVLPPLPVWEKDYFPAFFNGFPSRKTMSRSNCPETTSSFAPKYWRILERSHLPSEPSERTIHETLSPLLMMAKR